MPDLHPDISKLVASGKLPAALAGSVSALEPGTFVLHKSWGVGKVAEWDLIGDRMIVDFEDKPGHALKLEFAAKSLDPLNPSHILARRHGDLKSLQEMAEKDCTSLVRLALESHKNSMSLDAFEAVVKGKIVSDARFKTWWENTKKELRKRPEFIVPSKRTLPLELRAAQLKPTDALRQDFSDVRDLKGKIKALDTIIRELALFSNPGEELADIAREAEDSATQNLKLRSADAFELLMSRDDLLEKIPALREQLRTTLAQAVAQEHLRLHEFVGSLSVTKQQRLFEALPEALGENWTERAFAMVNRLNGRSLNEMAKVMAKRGDGDKMTGWLKTSVGHRSLSTEAMVWVCAQRGGLTSKVFSGELSGALIAAIERDHFDEDKKANRVMDAIMDDKELIADLLAGAEMTMVNNFARQVLLSPAFEELSKRSLMARIIKAYPEVQELVNERGSTQQNQEPLIVSWTSLEQRKKEYDHLVNVEIPKNREDISIAREYGDLRENFEFKSAKEYQRVLMRRRIDMERDLSNAQGTDFSEAKSDVVGIGTVVSVKDVETKKLEEYTILGAWDTNLAENVISYLSVTAKALDGKAVGDVIELPTEDSAVVRNVEITAIRKCEFVPAAQSMQSSMVTFFKATESENNADEGDEESAAPDAKE